MRKTKLKIIVALIGTLTLCITTPTYAAKKATTTQPAAITHPSDSRNLTSTLLSIITNSTGTVAASSTASTTPATALSTVLATQENIYDVNTSFTASQSEQLFLIALAFAVLGFFLAEYTILSNSFRSFSLWLKYAFEMRDTTTSSRMHQTHRRTQQS